MSTTLKDAQQSFLHLLQSLSVKDQPELVNWIRDSFTTDDLEARRDENVEGDVEMQLILADLRDSVPLSAVFQTEKIIFPQTGLDSDCDPTTTIHVDSFLYDDDDIDTLCDEGKLSRNYCRACGSHTVAPLTFISHSASLHQLKFIFRSLLPPLTGKSVLDVGSRLGGVLYAAYFFNVPSQIVGVEVNEDLCRVQNQIVAKHQLGDRIKVVNDDVMNRPELVSTADVIVLNNVFQFFLPIQEQPRAWQFLRNHTKSGCVLVTIPSLQILTAHLALGFNLSDWVADVSTTHLTPDDSQVDEEKLEELRRVCLYTVK